MLYLSLMVVVIASASRELVIAIIPLMVLMVRFVRARRCSWDSPPPHLSIGRSPP